MAVRPYRIRNRAGGWGAGSARSGCGTLPEFHGFLLLGGDVQDHAGGLVRSFIGGGVCQEVAGGLELVPAVPEDVRGYPKNPEHDGNHKDH